MPTNDMQEIVKWWLGWSGLGLVAWPFVYRVFDKWEDKGFLLSKAVGVFGTTYLVWILGTIKLLQYSRLSIIISALAVFTLSYAYYKFSSRENLPIKKINWKIVIAQEMIFFSLLSGWSWVRGHSPDIKDLEKFMDYGFARSISNSTYFPPKDMWFAGESINYYYFGHLSMSTVSKLTDQDLDVSFNLMLATIFALCFCMSFGIGRELLSNLSMRWRVIGGLLIAYMVTLSGNLHTIYAYTSGYNYDSENPPPFWELSTKFGSNSEGETNEYWYPNATRFIPYTIHEFPSYSFVVSDIHGHVLSIPLSLLAIALIANFFIKSGKVVSVKESAIFGVVLGWLFTTNALDGPIYLGIFIFLTGVRIFDLKKLIRLDLEKKSLIDFFSRMLVVVAVFIITTLPFTLFFKSFVSGVGVNCPPSFLAFESTASGDEGFNKIGPFIFGTVEKCQKSPVWMLLVLWGFFLVNFIKMVFSKIDWGDKKILLAFGLYCAGLILFAEFFYFKDIYPQHFRSNTMFKLGYQAFIMMSIVSGAVIVNSLSKIRKNIIFILFVVPLLYLVSIYPLFSIKSYFGELSVDNYKGLNGTGWLAVDYADDLEAINWLRDYASKDSVIIEASGDSYTEYSRVSTFTGLQTIAGWTVHEWLWRGDYGPIANRNEEVRVVYEEPDSDKSREVIRKYAVGYIIDGELERKKYTKLNSLELAKLGKIVFESPTTKIIQVNLE